MLSLKFSTVNLVTYGRFLWKLNYLIISIYKLRTLYPERSPWINFPAYGQCSLILVNEPFSVEDHGLECPVCKMIFKGPRQKGVYKTHFETIHQGKKLSPTCIICGRVFNKESDRKEHQQNCPNILKPRQPSKHVCLCCDRNFDTLKGLNIHRTLYHERSPHVRKRWNSAERLGKSDWKLCTIIWWCQSGSQLHVQGNQRGVTLVNSPSTG